LTEERSSEKKGNRGKKKKTVLRTIRLSEELDDLLARDAETKRMTTNGLISSIFAKYSEWDRYEEKFGYVSVTRQLFRSLLEAAGEEKVGKIARELTPRLHSDVMQFWFNRKDLGAFLDSFYLYSKYAGTGEGEIVAERGEYSTTIHHDLGRYWSVYLRNFIQESMRSVLGFNPVIEISDDSVTIHVQT
jgi:hypothetical protein